MVREDWVPDTVDVKAWVLGYGVVLVDLNGFSDPSGVPMSDGGDEVTFIPVNVVELLLCVLDDG